MAAPIYSIITGGAVALVASTAKSVLGVKAHANSGIQLSALKLGFDATAAGTCLVEVCYCTWATDSPGTNSTSVTPVQKSGRVLTAGFTAGKNWTTEPTSLTVLDEFLLSINQGTALVDIPLGNEYDSALAEGFVIRLTSSANVNVRGTIDVSRI